MPANFFFNPWKHHFPVVCTPVNTVPQEVDAGYVCYCLFCSFKGRWDHVSTKPIPAECDFSKSGLFYQELREGGVNATNLTLRNYKPSDPEDLVDIFIYRAKPVCPISSCLHIYVWGVLQVHFSAVRYFHQFLEISSPRHYLFPVINLTVFGLEQHLGQQPRACQMHRYGLLGNANQTPFSSIFGRRL